MKIPNFAATWIFVLSLPFALSGNEPSPAATAVPSVPAQPRSQAQPSALQPYAAVGSEFAQGIGLPELGWTPKQFEAFLEGLRAAYHGKSYAFDDSAKALFEQISKKAAEIQKHELERAFAQPAFLQKYLGDMRTRFGLQQTESGLNYLVTSKGLAGRPSIRDFVTLNLSARAYDGRTNLPQLSAANQNFRVADLLPGLAEGVQMMTPGSRGTFVLPPALSFGKGVWPEGIERGTPLIFSVTLIRVGPSSPSPAP
jgi:FKBP-type peptidyl-prolyl cis-trans isomerase FkpA